jgi:ABC-type sugar transport system ATPase subunit
VTVRRGGVTVLEGVSFVIQPGGFLRVLGANGAGKTSLLAAIAGRLALARGAILFDGAAPPRGAAARARRGLARTFQAPRPFGEWTVRENVALAAERAGNLDAVDGLLAELELTAGVNELSLELPLLLRGAEAPSQPLQVLLARRTFEERQRPRKIGGSTGSRVRALVRCEPHEFLWRAVRQQLEEQPRKFRHLHGIRRPLRATRRARLQQVYEPLRVDGKLVGGRHLAQVPCSERIRHVANNGNRFVPLKRNLTNTKPKPLLAHVPRLHEVKRSPRLIPC